MKTMVCEMCGGHDVVKAGGVYVCQHCGTKYDVEEARKLIVTIDGPVSVDGVATADNLMARAEEFYYKGDRAKALEYVNRVLDIDVNHPRAREMQRALESVPVPPRRVYEQHPVRYVSVTTAASAKSKMVAFLLCLFLGYFGVHNFYVGKIGKGVLYFFTSGLFGIGWLWDMIQIARGKFTDKDGFPLRVS